jgi:hypothetical protein
VSSLLLNLLVEAFYIRSDLSCLVIGKVNGSEDIGALKALVDCGVLFVVFNLLTESALRCREGVLRLLAVGLNLLRCSVFLVVDVLLH